MYPSIILVEMLKMHLAIVLLMASLCLINQLLHRLKRYIFFLYLSKRFSFSPAEQNPPIRIKKINFYFTEKVQPTF
jgi:hypothetical protein